MKRIYIINQTDERQLQIPGSQLTIMQEILIFKSILNQIKKLDHKLNNTQNGQYTEIGRECSAWPQSRI